MHIQIEPLDGYEPDDVAKAERSFEVTPRRMSEFACAICHLVNHHSCLRGSPGNLICRDCASDLRIE